MKDKWCKVNDRLDYENIYLVSKQVHVPGTCKQYETTDLKSGIGCTASILVVLSTCTCKINK